MTTANPITFNNQFTEVMRIDASGNLGIYSPSTTPKDAAILINQDNSEMLRVSKEGFYVRGEKVPVDGNEATTVYEAFKSWLTWASLTRDYK